MGQGRQAGQRRMAEVLAADAIALSGLTLSAGQLKLPTGTAALPSLCFSGSPTDGMYETAGGVIRWAIGGSNVLSFTSTSISSSLSLDVGGYITYNNEASPAAFGANQDNYTPNVSTSWLRVSASIASVNITGMANGADGKLLGIINIGASNNIVLVHESASSTAANRFALPSAGNVTLGPGDGCLLVYDGVSSRHRLFGVAL
jgi:hypothetical protein